MLLYHAISLYQLLNLILHKKSVKKDEKAVLMIPFWIEEKLKDYKKLLDFFDDIILFDAYIDFKNEDQYAAEATAYFNNVFASKGYNISNFNEIIVGGAHYNFGAYLIKSNISFTFWEDASGLLNKPHILESIDTKFSEGKSKFNKKYGLYNGEHSLIIKRIGNLCTQDKEANNSNNNEHFDVIKSLFFLSQKERKQVISTFSNVSSICVPENAVLVLTQHFTNLRILTFEEQILIYQIFVDYFLYDEHLIIKPHPDDLMYYSYLFPKAVVIREKFPSEFLPIIFDNKPKMIATISSTAINNLYGYFDYCFSLDTLYEKTFRFTHRYYFTLKILEKLNVSTIKTIGTDTLLLKKLGETKNFKFNSLQISELEQRSKADVIIIDDINTIKGNPIEIMTEGNKEDIIIFINSNKEFCFYDINYKSLWDNIIPICIKKRAIRDKDVYENTSEEVIYFYCKDEKTRRRVECMEEIRKLDNTGLEVSLEPLTPNEQRIKILEGILEATEKRLLYYINEYEKLKNKVR